jgi:sn-glycerol 3-phosphate transport system ATP-binding protein
MNIFDASIDGGKVMFRGAVIGKADAGDGDVKLGIRPEHLVRDNKGGLELSLQIAEPLGANTLLHGRVASSEQPVTVSLAGVHSIEAGQGSERFSVNPSHIHLFDPVTGVRLQR